MSTFKWDLLYWTFLNELKVVITLMQPLLIPMLITYIKDGQNAWEKYDIQFHKFADDHQMSWLTQQKQYGLRAAFILVFS